MRSLYFTPSVCIQEFSVAFVVAIFWYGSNFAFATDDIQFNMDVLDVKDRGNIDLSQFSRRGYIMPGTYNMALHVNSLVLPEQEVRFIAQQEDTQSSAVCLSPDQVEQLGLKEALMHKLTWFENGQCLDMEGLPGMDARGDLATSSVYLNIPQVYLEYVSENWDPPSRWDDGVSGLLFDYNVNFQAQRQQQLGTRSYNASGNGTTGANFGAWRLRADWQSRIEHMSGGNGTLKDWEWSRYYAYRAIPRLRSKLTLGEDYLNSSLFDSFRFTGIGLTSDDNMLPPNLRGYAPEVSGIAKTNAKVTVSQQGRVLYETQVAAGPFRIQDINDAVSGQLDVRVEEQDGSVQQFQMDTATIPYLTRPGSVRYKLVAGRPSDWRHHTNGDFFTTGEFSWGVSNGWSLYGGGIAGGDYNAISVGLGRDLMVLGALSFDATHSRASLPGQDTLNGTSYRLSYSKNFDEYDSQVTFAGYRFSEREFMSMSEYLDARYSGSRRYNSKEMYTLSLNKQFRDLDLSVYLNYHHQTYWDRPDSDRYNLSLANYFDIGSLKNVSLSLSAYRNRYSDANDDGMYLSLSLPWGNGTTVSYNTSLNKQESVNSLSYYNRLDERNNWQVSAGTGRSGIMGRGYLTHEGDLARVNVNASYQEGRYSSAGMSLQGGATATMEGAALHRVSIPGSTRLLVDTSGVADVPVRGYGASSRSNSFGKAVVGDMNSYYRNNASIDLNNAADNIEATRSVVQATLTEGAIGYRRFDVVSGEKVMAQIRLADGGEPPFGATVLNRKQQEAGIVNDGGHVYLSGVNAEEQMQVHWNGTEQCVITLPAILPKTISGNLLLPCEQ